MEKCAPQQLRQLVMMMGLRQSAAKNSACLILLADCKTLASKREGYGGPRDVTSLSLSKLLEL